MTGKVDDGGSSEIVLWFKIGVEVNWQVYNNNGIIAFLSFRLKGNFYLELENHPK
jgi:hypothetical protein